MSTVAVLQPSGGAVDRSSDDEVLLALARVVVGISTRAAGRLGGISVTQLRALTLVGAGGAARPGALAGELGVSPSAATRLADRLVLAGLVRRETAPADRREVLLRLTAEGAAVLDRYDELRLTELRERLDAVPDRSSVLDAVARFAGAGSPAEAVR
jgi:DNA-binding MarR family transcriptional regulator